MCTKARQRTWVSCSVTLHLIPLRQVFPPDLELVWWPASPSDLLSYFALHGVRLSVCAAVDGCWGSKPKFYACTAGIPIFGMTYLKISYYLLILRTSENNIK